MSVQRDEKRNTFHVFISTTDINGNSKAIHKRGFKTKREAQKWEREYKTNSSGELHMPFKDFVTQVYLPALEPRLKKSTWLTKTNMIYKHVLPFFGEMKLDEIGNNEIMKWQNMMLKAKNPKNKKPFSKSYLMSVNTQVTAIFSYAMKYYGLNRNPAHVVGNMGSEDEIDMKFWTLDQYNRFAEAMRDEPIYYYAFQILYWAGIREGELLALTFKDIDFKKGTLRIDKTLHRFNGVDVITPPKTKQSYRTITLPSFLLQEMQEYKDMVYQPTENDRMFGFYKSSLTRAMARGTKKAGLPRIRVHDLRHSAVSLLIEKGFSALAIGQRIGHKAVDITYRYAHLFPTVQIDMAKTLDNAAKEMEDVQKKH